MKLVKNILMGLGYINLWLFISGLYNNLHTFDNLLEGLMRSWIVGLIGIIFRWFSLERQNRARVLTIIDDLLILTLIRGVIGVVAHFMLPSMYHRIVTDSLMYGGIFIAAGAVGLYFLKKVPMEKKVIKID